MLSKKDALSGPAASPTPPSMDMATLPPLKRFFKTQPVVAWSLTVILAIIAAITIAVVSVVMILNSKFNAFLTAADLTKPELKSILESTTTTQPQSTSNHTTFLILGTDSLTTRGDVPPLTDTMMLASVDYQTGEIILLPLPRDLYSQAYQTKINALYSYSLERDADQPTEFVETALEEMTGVPINYTLVISMDQLARIIDDMGGITVDVPEGFTDEEFPRADVDVTTVTDPALLYETVTFETGPQTMDGHRALQYIRSRKGDNNQNTDLARSTRQQLVISAVMARLQDPIYFFQHPEVAGGLVKLYQDEFAQFISLPELGAVALKLLNEAGTFRLKTGSLTIFPEDPAGSIFHPDPRLYQGQWVYAPVSDELFATEVMLHLGLTDQTSSTSATPAITPSPLTPPQTQP